MRKRNVFICFIGVDGSGKTTQAMKLEKKMKEQGIRVKYVWIGWAPTIFNPVIKLCKRLLIRREKIDETDYEDFTAAKKKFLKKHFLSGIWMCYVLLDYAVQIFIKVTIPLLLGNSVICDRYIYDLLVNLATRYGTAPSKILRLARNKRLLSIFPKPTFVFFLDVPAKTAYARKDDIPSMDYLIDHSNLYSKLCDQLRITRIDGLQKSEFIHQQLSNLIFHYLEK